MDISGNIVIIPHFPSNVTPCDNILPYAQVYASKNRKRADMCKAWGFCN